jgi:hypothetical protein
MNAKPLYHSYLLRFWQEQQDGITLWRASLENVQTSERRYFPDAEPLFEFLRNELSTEPYPNGATINH